MNDSQKASPSRGAPSPVYDLEDASGNRLCSFTSHRDVITLIRWLHRNAQAAAERELRVTVYDGDHEPRRFFLSEIFR